MKTKAAVLVRTGEPLVIKELNLPELKPGQVAVKLAFSGICHTQLGEVRGKRGPDKYLPHTLGHEGSGTVIATGPEVTKVKPGDPVVLTWIKGAGADVPSTTYTDEAGNPVNSGAISTFMHHTVTCESKLVPIRPDMPLLEAALLGCAVPTGCGIIKNSANLKKGGRAAVFGIGGIGAGAVLGAVMAGASQVIAVDIVPEKLTKAQELGATHCVNAGEKDPVSAIMEITGSQGVDLAVEAVGSVAVMAAAFKSVKNFGGLCVVAGNPEPGKTVCLDPYDLIRGKRIMGTWGGETDPDKDIPLYADAYLAGGLNLKALVSRTYDLEDINQALDDLESGKILRAMVCF